MYGSVMHDSGYVLIPIPHCKHFWLIDVNRALIDITQIPAKICWFQFWPILIFLILILIPAKNGIGIVHHWNGWILEKAFITAHVLTLKWAHGHCQVTFLSPPVQIARWDHMRRFLCVCLSVLCLYWTKNRRKKTDGRRVIQHPPSTSLLQRGTIIHICCDR